MSSQMSTSLENKYMRAERAAVGLGSRWQRARQQGGLPGAHHARHVGVQSGERLGGRREPWLARHQRARQPPAQRARRPRGVARPFHRRARDREFVRRQRPPFSSASATSASCETSLPSSMTAHPRPAGAESPGFPITWPVPTARSERRPGEFGEREAPVRPNENPLGVYQPAGDAHAARVERAERRQYFAQEPDDGAGIRVLPRLLHRPEDRGEALASR